MMNCSVLPEMSGITISVNFVEHSLASGALLAFIFINKSGTIDFRYSFFRVLTMTDASDGLNLPLNMLYSGQYVVYAYDIESNEQTINGINHPASNCNFTIMGSQGYILSFALLRLCLQHSYFRNYFTTPESQLFNQHL